MPMFGIIFFLPTMLFQLCSAHVFPCVHQLPIYSLLFVSYNVMYMYMCFHVFRRKSASQELSTLLREKEEQIAGLMKEGKTLSRVGKTIPGGGANLGDGLARGDK